MAHVYYDPYDVVIDDDPYPVWKRLRDETPLYHNEKYDFYALSRWDDVEAALLDWDTYRSGRGTILDVIRANVEIPPGIILFEDPPLHDLHRGLLARVFTSKRMNAIELMVRRYCAGLLDSLIEAQAENREEEWHCTGVVQARVVDDTSNVEIRVIDGDLGEWGDVTVRRRSPIEPGAVVFAPLTIPADVGIMTAQSVVSGVTLVIILAFLPFVHP